MRLGVDYASFKRIKDQTEEEPVVIISRIPLDIGNNVLLQDGWRRTIKLDVIARGAYGYDNDCEYAVDYFVESKGPAYRYTLTVEK